MADSNEYDEIIRLVNEHSDKVKREAAELRKQIELDEQRKAECAKKLEELKKQSLKERDEVVYESRIRRGEKIKALLLAFFILLTTYTVTVIHRATVRVDESHEVTYHYEGAGAGLSKTFEEGEPSLKEYAQEFWDVIGDDIHAIVDVYTQGRN